VKRILGLYAKHQNKALLEATNGYGKAMSICGEYKLTTLNLLDNNDTKRLVSLLKSGEVDFAFGVQGVGSNIKLDDDSSIWSVSKTPFVSFHFDHPCHNPYNHANVSPYVGNLYSFKSFLEVKNKYLPSNQFSDYLPSSFMLHQKLNSCNFTDRPYKFLYIKTGATLDKIIEDVGFFPKEIQGGFFNSIEELKLNPNLEIADIVANVFTKNDLDHTKFQIQFWDIVRLIDLYIRQERAIKFVEWLKLQDGAFILGDGWDFIDKSKAKANFLPSTEILNLQDYYCKTKFVCNTNPYGKDMVHERMIYGLGANACVISDKNEWIEKNLDKVSALHLFDWDKDLGEQLNKFTLDNVEKEYENDANKSYDDIVKYYSVSPVEKIISFSKKLNEFAKNNS